jgi:hypothetical protein
MPSAMTRSLSTTSLPASRFPPGRATRATPTELTCTAAHAVAQTAVDAFAGTGTNCGVGSGPPRQILSLWQAGRLHNDQAMKPQTSRAAPAEKDKQRSGLPGNAKERSERIKAAIKANRETLRRLAK